MKKAQLTIEYLVILVIMLLLFNGVTLDLLSTSVTYTERIQTSEMMNATKLTITDAMNLVSLQGSGAKKTVSARAPPDCDYVIDVIGQGIISLACEYGTPSYNGGFNGLVVASALPKTSLSLSNNLIKSGELGTITVSKE